MNVDPHKYKYSSYGIGFASRREFLFIDENCRKNVVIFGAGMSSFMHNDNQEKDILTLGDGPTQGLDDATLITEAKYHINIT